MRRETMSSEESTSGAWPELPALEDWAETLETLHLWTQIVGKVRLAKSPWCNHSWYVPLYVTSSGLSTSTVYDEARGFDIDFDFVDHRLRIETADGERRSFSLEPMAVAEFYEKIERSLGELDIEFDIWPMPVEIPDPIEAFPEDHTHASYDRESVNTFWRALSQSHRVLSAFRARFVGKASPVHFFWGAFDLAATRFSGREAPEHPGGAPNVADRVMEEAYSHELSSAGFWPGTGLGEAAFYAYAYPEPDGFRDFPVRPDAAYYHDELGEYVLPYETVRAADEPDALLLEFLQTSYEAAAELGDWDRAGLEKAGRAG